MVTCWRGRFGTVINFGGIGSKINVWVQVEGRIAVDDSEGYR